MKIELEHGEGPEFVYAYYFPSQTKNKSVYPCKIGKTSNCPIKRIQNQQASMQEEPIIGLLLRTRNAFWTEQFIHEALKEKRLDSYGKEWFETNSEEILQCYISTQTKLNIVVRLPKQLGAAIRRARKLKKLSQSKLGENVGIRQSTISSLENGKASTSIETIYRVLSELELELVLQPRKKGSPEDIITIFSGE